MESVSVALTIAISPLLPRPTDVLATDTTIEGASGGFFVLEPSYFVLFYVGVRGVFVVVAYFLWGTENGCTLFLTRVRGFAIRGAL